MRLWRWESIERGTDAMLLCTLPYTTIRRDYTDGGVLLSLTVNIGIAVLRFGINY